MGGISGVRDKVLFLQGFAPSGVHEVITGSYDYPCLVILSHIIHVICAN